jgi:hypothetical protein
MSDEKGCREALQAALAWIDAVPPETQLPAMPGFDRDWANGVLEQSSRPAPQVEDLVKALERSAAALESAAASVRHRHMMASQAAHHEATVARAALAAYRKGQ